MPRVPPPSLGWCVTRPRKMRHLLYSWGNWGANAPSLTHGRGCRRCGKRWGWVYTTHHVRLMDLADPEAHAQVARNKRITPAPRRKRR